jgi:hypothetical protein
MSDLQCTSSWLQQEPQVRPPRSDPSVFPWSVEPLNHIPELPLYIALHSPHLETQHPKTWQQPSEISDADQQ